ncbi:MAG TPA: ribosome maturation factor RimM [Acidobacteriaceae bacterium]|nr:ribosome maturation factor RimM [Acidobacteriaceae bacterium]
MELSRPHHSRAQQHDSAVSLSVSQPTGHSRPTTGADQHAPPAPSAQHAGKPSQWVLIAHVVRPHGRHGELVADILTDFPELFHGRPRLWLIPSARVGTAPRELHMENFWFLRSRVVFKFEGVDSISAAEGIRGYDVAIPAAERAPLEPGSWYAADLIGCRVFDLNRSREIGEIVDIDRGSSSADLLVVRSKSAGLPDNDVLIPFVRDYLVRVALAELRVEMRLPEGLLDINAPLTEEEKRRAGG